MFHANLNYYIIIILSPYSINTQSLDTHSVILNERDCIPQYTWILRYTVSFIQYNRVCVQ